MRGVLRAPPCCRLTRHRRLCDPHHLQGLDRRFEVQGEAVPPFFQYMRSKLVRRTRGGCSERVCWDLLLIWPGATIKHCKLERREGAIACWTWLCGGAPKARQVQASEGCACQSFCPPCLAAQLQVAVGVLESASSYDGSERISVPTQVGAMALWWEPQCGGLGWQPKAAATEMYLPAVGATAHAPVQLISTHASPPEPSSPPPSEVQAQGDPLPQPPAGYEHDRPGAAVPGGGGRGVGRCTFLPAWCRSCACDADERAAALQRVAPVACPSPRLQYYTDTLDATIAQLKSEGR